MSYDAKRVGLSTICGLHCNDYLDGMGWPSMAWPDLVGGMVSDF